MKKFYLYKICAGERVGNPIVACGFESAEKQAKELLAEIWPNSPCDDTYIACVESEWQMQQDHLIMQKDVYGDVYWKMAIYGTYCLSHFRLLKEDEEEYLKSLREEEERSIYELSYKELIKLRSEICIESIYSSDYENSFSINEDEVYHACDYYKIWCAENKIEDTPDNFAIFIQNEY